MKQESTAGGLQMLSRYRLAIMGFAALWIVIMHCWLLIVPNRPVLGAIENFIKWNGALGLEMFFFYSGMSLTYAIRKNTLRQFYLRRLKRVVFPYWVMAALNAVTAGWTTSVMLKHALGIMFVTEDIFALLWFVPAIIILYALFPAYHRLMMRAENKTAFTLCALCIWMYASMSLRDVMRTDLWYITNRLPCFLLGIHVGEICRGGNARMTRTHWTLCLLSIPLGYRLYFAAMRGYVPAIPQLYYFAFTLISVPLCFLLSGLFAWLEARKGWIRHAAGLLIRAFSFVGTFSLELYCIHQWLFSQIYTLLEGHVTYLTINFISIPLVVAAGWLLYAVHMGFWRAAQKAVRCIRAEKKQHE